jgi:hypothetical protein
LRPTKERTMKELEEVCRKLDRLEGSVLAMESLLMSICEVLPLDTIPVVNAFFASELEAVRHKLKNFAASRSTVESFEVDARRLAARFERLTP